MEQFKLIAQWAGWPALVAVLILFGGYEIRRLKNRIDSLKEDNDRFARELGRRQAGKYPIKHYVLFWWHSPTVWARDDWDNARSFVSKYKLTQGFSAEDAANAEQVTIVGGPGGVDNDIEAFLKKMGCRVERFDGLETEDTARILIERTESGNAFIEGTRRRGY